MRKAKAEEARRKREEVTEFERESRSPLGEVQGGALRSNGEPRK